LIWCLILLELGCSDRYFATVCFRLVYSSDEIDDGDEVNSINNEINKRLLEIINASGKIYMTHAVIGGIYVIRFAVGATLTEEFHVRDAWKVVQHHANLLLSQIRD